MSESFEMVPLNQEKGRLSAYLKDGKIVLMILDTPDKIEELAKQLKANDVNLVNAIFVYDKKSKDLLPVKIEKKIDLP